MQLLDAVAEDFCDELKRLLGGGSLGIHLEELVVAVERGEPDIIRLFRYGIERLPSDDARPDDALAAFFIVLSELQSCSAELRILATKCMEYCETDPMDGWSDPLSKLKESYADLADQLKPIGR
jgi:hypothetical protein